MDLSHTPKGLQYQITAFRLFVYEGESNILKVTEG